MRKLVPVAVSSRDGYGHVLSVEVAGGRIRLIQELRDEAELGRHDHRRRRGALLVLVASGLPYVSVKSDLDETERSCRWS